MLTIAKYEAEEHTFYARVLNADAEIRDRANETLCAPEIGDFSDAGVVWEN